MLIAREFLFADRDQSRALGLPPEEHGLVLCVDENAERWTLVGDAERARMIHEALGSGEATGEVAPEVFELRLRGWPDDWVARPSRPYRD